MQCRGGREETAGYKAKEMHFDLQLLSSSLARQKNTTTVGLPLLLLLSFVAVLRTPSFSFLPPHNWAIWTDFHDPMDLILLIRKKAFPLTLNWQMLVRFLSKFLLCPERKIGFQKVMLLEYLHVLQIVKVQHWKTE